MSEDIVDKALKLLEGDESLHENSVLHNFYKKFSTDIKNAYAQYEACKEEEKKKKEKEKPIKSIVTCSLEEDNISLNTNLENFKTSSIQDNNRCDYLLQWMSNQIYECKNNTYCIIRLHNMFSKFWENSGCCEKKEGSNKGNCKETFVIEFDKEIIKNKKELYQFMENYNKIENAIYKNMSVKKETYCKYLKYVFDLYHFMESEVNEHVYEKYKKVLKHFENTFRDEDKLSKLKTECKYPNLSVMTKRELNNAILSSEVNFERFIPFDGNSFKYVIESPSEMDDILKETPSYKLYKEFEKKVEADTEKKYCTEIFKEVNKYQNEGIDICKKIINNFNKLYKNEIKTSVDNPCLHYKYWVYHEIWKLIISQSEQGNAKEIINKFLDIQKGKNVYSSDAKKVCHYYFIFNDFIELNSKKEEKDLHDYFKYYHTIYENISAHISDKEKYKKYIQYIYELYKRHKIDWKCCDASYGVDPLCRHYFKCEEEYNPSDLLEILNGAKKEDIKKKYKTPPVVLFGEEKLTGDLKEE
ncbi:PIR Superfamily Protein, partial [Plasmodium ovale curtisi]